MGGPWKCREVDARAWRAPVPRSEARVMAIPGSLLAEATVVAAYIVSVVASLLVLLVVLKQGW